MGSFSLIRQAWRILILSCLKHRSVNGCWFPRKSGGGEKVGMKYALCDGSRAGAARRSEPLMRLTGNHQEYGSQSPFVTLTSRIGSPPIFTAIFRRIYAAANTPEAMLVINSVRTLIHYIDTRTSA